MLACHRIRSRDRQLNDDVSVLKILATLAGQLLQLQALVADKTRAAAGTQPAGAGVRGHTACVLLLGESGTGKELFARAAHLSSQRRDQPFIKIHCAVIPDTLFESELFGYERGAFTGAQTARAGWFEQADRGTIFLDEIGEMPLAMQTKLLRTLQEGTIIRLCGKREVKVSVRLEQHAWPGNIRELGNVIERLVLLTDSTMVSRQELERFLPLKRAADSGTT